MSGTHDHDHPHARAHRDGDVHQHHHHHHHDHPTGLRGLVRSVLTPHSHDPASSIDAAMEGDAAGIRTLKISLVVLLVTALAQLGVVLATDSVALLADTIHNFSDALSAAPLWIAFVLARRPATQRFTYGLGRVEDVAGLFIVLLIALSACVAGVESVRGLLDPREVTHVGVVLAAGVIGFAGNELVAVFRIRVGRRIGSAALVADGLHARTDGFTSLAVALGALGVMAGFPLADPIIGLVITVAILVTLKGSATEVFRRLLDGVDPNLTRDAERSLRQTAGVLAVDSVQMRWMGHRLHAEARVAVDPDLHLDAAHEIAHRAEDTLRRSVDHLAGVTVHVSPLVARTPVQPAST